MPFGLKVALSFIVNATLFGGLGCIIFNMYNHPDEWFFWRNN